jgi:hypothetical protein
MTRFSLGQFMIFPMSFRSHRWSFIFLVIVAAGLSCSIPLALCDDRLPKSKATDRFEPKIAPASNEAKQAMAQVRLPRGLTIELFAAEPLLANPVAFCFDEKGRCFVAETFRIQHGVSDNRDHMSWLDDDLASFSQKADETFSRQFQHASATRQSESSRLIGINRFPHGLAR